MSATMYFCTRCRCISLANIVVVVNGQCVCPGRPVQHLLHHRHGRAGPRLAVCGGWRSDVHSRVCRLHRCFEGKHLSAQVCMYQSKS